MTAIAVRTPRRTVRATSALTHVLGVVAFTWPFVAPAGRSAETSAHASDAPLFAAVLGALMIAIAASDLHRGRTDARRLALLGVLAGVNAVLRLPGALGGASLMFVLPVLCGYVYGPSFGFLLGASSFAASAVITAGIGPWLPFQMWALGWVGAGAGLLRRPLAGRPRAVVPALAVYGWAAGLLFGALLNLWFWPFVAGDGPMSFEPSATAAANAGRYLRFYLVTSLAWDSARAIANAALIVFVGPPLLRAFERFRARIEVRWVDSEL